MARTNQTIQVFYWQKAKDRGLTPDEKLVELFLMTCPECGASGVFRMDTSSIAYDIGYPEPKVKGILKSLQEKNRVYIFDGNWVFVRGKFEYEPTKSEKIIKCVENELSVSPKLVIMQFLSIYDTLFDTLPDSLSDTISCTNTITITKTNIDTPDSNKSESTHKLVDEKKQERLDRCKEFIINKLNFNFKDKQLEKQTEALEKIFRIDKAKIEPKVTDENWRHGITKVLLWARDDTEPNSNGFCWSNQFNSIERLRDNDCHKLKNMIGGYKGYLARQEADDN